MKFRISGDPQVGDVSKRVWVNISPWPVDIDLSCHFGSLADPRWYTMQGKKPGYTWWFLGGRSVQQVVEVDLSECNLSTRAWSKPCGFVGGATYPDSGGIYSRPPYAFHLQVGAERSDSGWYTLLNKMRTAGTFWSTPPLLNKVEWIGLQSTSEWSCAQEATSVLLGSSAPNFWVGSHYPSDQPAISIGACTTQTTSFKMVNA
jgi:hypothetical protein